MSDRAKAERSDGLGRRELLDELLAVVGLSGLAGCSDLGGLTGERTDSVDSDELDFVDSETDLEPPVPPSVPVQIDTEFLRQNRERVVTLLSTLPVTLGPEEIPNGYVRQKLTEAAADATAALDDARTAATPLLALQALQSGREAARFAAAGWAFADRGLSANSLREELNTTVVAAREASEKHEYLGGDRVRAVAVHRRIEMQLYRARRSEVEPSGDDGSQLLRVAELGRTAESARAHLTAGRHLSEQFARSLPSDAGSVRNPITRAARRLFETVRSKQSELPPEPTADDWGVPEQLVDELRWRVDTEDIGLADAVGPASAVSEALRLLTHVRALDWATRKIDAGEIGSVESVARVESIRDAAYDALGDAQRRSPAPALSQPVPTDAGWTLVAADRRLTRLSGDVSVRQ
ncbi:MAG: hypothetical protein ABEI99_00600, partial [Halobaculum sp.]